MIGSIGGLAIGGRLHRSLIAPIVVLAAVAGAIVAIPPAVAAAGFEPPMDFGSRVDYPVGSNPTDIVDARLNEDRFLDLVTANEGSNDVSVLLGKAHGSFKNKKQRHFDVGAEPTSVAVADLNGDGRQDLITGNSGSSDVSVLLGRKGGGDFRRAQDYDVDGGAATVEKADVDGNGVPDIVTSGPNGFASLIGNGDGTLEPPVFFDPNPTQFPPTPGDVRVDFSLFRVADFNNDGLSDIAAKARLTEDTFLERDQMSVMLGHGDGSYGEPSHMDTVLFPVALAVADIKQDGDQDIAVVSGYYKDGSIQLLFGAGDGTFPDQRRVGVPTPLGYEAYAIDFADMDGDGNLDLVARTPYVDDASGDLHYLPGNGDGTFGQALNFKLDLGYGNFAAARFNRDRFGDVAALSFNRNAVAVFLRSRG